MSFTNCTLIIESLRIVHRRRTMVQERSDLVHFTHYPQTQVSDLVTTELPDFA